MLKSSTVWEQGPTYWDKGEGGVTVGNVRKILGNGQNMAIFIIPTLGDVSKLPSSRIPRKRGV